MNYFKKIMIYCTVVSLMFLENKIFSAAGAPVLSIHDCLQQAGLDAREIKPLYTDFELACFKGESIKVKKQLFYKKKGASHLLKKDGEELLLAAIGSVSPGARKKPYEKTIKSLLQAKAAVDTATTTTQQTPLMIAAKHGKNNLAKLFLRNLANWTLKDSTGKTAAQVATDHGYSINKLLFDYGVDPKILR